MKQNFFELKILIQKIIEFKEKNKLSYEKMGNNIGIDKAHLNRIVKMSTHPSFSFLVRLAHFMKIPLYSLFIPSEEMSRQEFANKVNEHTKELNRNPEVLAEKTNIPLLRLRDILSGDLSPTIKEKNALTNALSLEEEIDYSEIKLNHLKLILNDLGLKNKQSDNVIQYVKDNIE
ncbi:MAG: helix-turn-helix transcriptional regulator [Halanaerobiales bacterium]|nr:helix-turn-helix transcriptional regulator [Halanaerobiales bacterium]